MGRVEALLVRDVWSTRTRTRHLAERYALCKNVEHALADAPSWFYDVHFANPFVFLTVTVLLTVAIVASIPASAQRATHANSIEALRADQEARKRPAAIVSTVFVRITDTPV